MDPCGPDAGQERGCARPISILAPARPFPARIVEVVMVGGVNRRMHGYAMLRWLKAHFAFLAWLHSALWTYLSVHRQPPDGNHRRVRGLVHSACWSYLPPRVTTAVRGLVRLSRHLLYARLTLCMPAPLPVHSACWIYLY